MFGKQYNLIGNFFWPMVSPSINTSLVKRTFVNIIDHLGVSNRRVHKDVKL